MADSPHLLIPLPDESRDLDEEVRVLREAWLILDTIVHEVRLAVANKAAADHSHTAETIQGLTELLADKMNASRTFALSDLTDVQGSAQAALNYILVMGPNEKWIPSSAIAALGTHKHLMSEIEGLAEAFQQLGSIVGRNLTVSATDPTGGQDGDIWFKV